MRNNCSKIRIVALLMVMLLGTINTWAIEILRKDAMICLAQKNLSVNIEGHNCTWTPGENGSTNGTCHYTWSANTDNLVKISSFGDNLKDVSNYKCIIVKTKNLTGAYRIVVRSRINDQDHTFVYGGISTSGVVAVPLDNRNGWMENYSQISLATFNNMRHYLKDICIAGFSGTGSLDFMEIALAKSIRTVNWNATNGHIELTNTDFPESQDNLTRNGDYFSNAGGWCGLTLSFDSELETSSFYVDGEYYNTEGQKTVTPDAPFLNNFLAIDMDGLHYKSKALRTNIAHSKMADFQVLFKSAGNMHIYKVILRNRDVKVVSFNSDEGSECADKESYKGKAITLPTPTKSSCTFLGWYDKNGNKVGDGGASYTPTDAVTTLTARWLEDKFGDLNADANTLFTESYEIPEEYQRTFTFRTTGNSSSMGWALWATRNARTANNRTDYFCMDLTPSMQMYDTEISALGEPEEMSIYIKNGDNLESLSTDAQWQQFRSDIANGCYVRVNVANYDKIITVYSVMKKEGRTYVYAATYDKHDSYAGAINVFFTPDHTILNRFIANNQVYVRAVNSAVKYPNNTEEKYQTCKTAITTLEGYELPSGTKVGQGDTIMYRAIPGRKWELQNWTALHVTLGVDNVESQRVVVPANYVTLTANFQRGTSFFDPATDRVFFEDFENLDVARNGNTGIETVTTEEKKAEYENTPVIVKDKETGDVVSNHAYMQGKYLNYGGKGRVLKDPVFGKYYQNLADGTNEYTKSVAENFLRIILTDEQREKIGANICRYDPLKWDDYKPENEREATIGFWVNAKIANKYELPLERGSMFCVFSNERFRKADAGADDDFQHPRFMFDLACNGTTYANMPNNFTKTGDDNKEIPVQRENFFFYGDTVPLTNTPTPSLFGEKFYKNAQDQTTSKFYDDDEWHYVAYVATNGLKTVTLFVDGEECGTMDMTTLGAGLTDFQEEGDFSGRTFFLRNIVLGGFTPHGLFFQKQYYEDAALAFDDIAIYSRALNADEIYDIMEAKQLKRDEWHFTTTLKADGMAGKNLNVLDGSTWAGSDGVYTLNGSIKKSELQIGHETIFSTEGLKFTGTKGQIIIDQKNGLIGLKRGAEIYVPDLNQGENVYFVVKSDDPEKYPLDPYDLWPVNDPCELRTRGVSLYGDLGKEEFSVFTGYKNNNIASDSYGFRVYRHGSVEPANPAHNNNNNNNILWISDVIISPYSLTYTNNQRKVNSINSKPQTRKLIHVDVERNGGVLQQPAALPQLIITNGTSTKNEKISDYSKDKFVAGSHPYIRFSSSAPHVATVNQSGQVTIKGIAGYATIKAELVFDNLQDGCISTAYQIRVENKPKTHRVEDNNTEYDVAYKKTVKANDGSDAITMSLGGWAYTANAYKGTVGDVMDNNGSATDSWTKGFVHNERNDVTPIDGFNTYSQGGQNAKSESYGDDDGRYIPTTQVAQVVRNVTPWTLPCRGSYLKFDAEKTGVLTVYVLQNGNLDKSDINKDYSDQIHWRPVYITNERGVCVPRVQYDTNSKISENDNFFKEGRRRAQFIEEIEGTYNQRLKDALLDWKGSNYDRFKLLLDHWENQGWKQKVIKTGDGGYMIMSKGIVRYSFNVVPGQTYYVFSNDTKIGYAGYNFEEGKILFDNASDSYDTNPMYSASVTTTPVVYKDELNYDPKLPEGINNMFSVPVEIQRSFKANTWSSICLPFSINRKQLEENFGKGTSVVLAKQVINHGYDKGRLELIWHVNQDIIAGYPYFILPTKNVEKIKVNVPYRIDQDRYLSKPYLAVSSNGRSFAHKSGYTYYDEYPYVFEGNFKDEVLPAGSYVMSNNGVLTRLKSSVTAKPFRAYLRKVGNGANAKPLTTMGFSDFEGETTSVEEILQDNGIILESSDVYGVNGVKVRSNTHSLEGLSKGVYVVNGKKYVVK